MTLGRSWICVSLPKVGAKQQPISCRIVIYVAKAAKQSVIFDYLTRQNRALF